MAMTEQLIANECKYIMWGPKANKHKNYIYIYVCQRGWNAWNRNNLWMMINASSISNVSPIVIATRCEMRCDEFTWNLNFDWISYVAYCECEFSKVYTIHISWIWSVCWIFISLSYLIAKPKYSVITWNLSVHATYFVYHSLAHSICVSVCVCMNFKCVLDWKWIEIVR